MLSLFITHLQGYKRQAVRSPVFITLEVICELILPLIMAEIVDVAIPAGDTAYIFRLGAVMLALSLLSMAYTFMTAWRIGNDSGRNPLEERDDPGCHCQLPDWNCLCYCHKMGLQMPMASIFPILPSLIAYVAVSLMTQPKKG